MLWKTCRKMAAEGKEEQCHLPGVVARCSNLWRSRFSAPHGTVIEKCARIWERVRDGCLKREVRFSVSDSGGRLVARWPVFIALVNRSILDSITAQFKRPRAYSIFSFVSTRTRIKVCLYHDFLSRHFCSFSSEAPTIF